MRKKRLGTMVVLAVMAVAPGRASAQAGNSPYAAMAALDAYLIADQQAEIALARSAAPPSVADDAEVLVLGRAGYTTAVKGRNGFVCAVERGWGAATDSPEFWNPRVRAPHCFNAAAARSFLPIYLMKTRLALAGKSAAQIGAAVARAFETRELPALEPATMVYMMSRQQYLNDEGKSWHPHLMFYVPGDVEKSWGANLAGSPVIAANDPEERVTIFMVVVGKWSDGTPAPQRGQ